MSFNITPRLATTIADSMSKVAETHPNDALANNYAAVAEKLETYGAPFALELTKLDILTIRVFVQNYLLSYEVATA